MPRRKTPITPKPDAPPVPTGVEPTRPQWEYFTATSLDGVFILDGWGIQGWELVTIYPVGDAMHAPVYYAVFKRQVNV